MSDAPEPHPLARPIDGVTNWMTLSRWIVKYIRDEYEVDEARLTRGVLLEDGIGLSIEQVELVMATIAASFSIRFPPETLDEILLLEELCMLASWMRGLYRQPEFISDAFAAHCRALNPDMAPE